MGKFLETKEGKFTVTVLAVIVIIAIGFVTGTYYGGFWGMTVIVVTAGAVGGVVNSLIKDSGFGLPGYEQVGSVTIFRTGFLGNIIIGAVAALISWGLYGPFATYFILGGPAVTDLTQFGLTLSSFVGAILVGIGGSQWISKELEGDTSTKAAAMILKKNQLNDEAVQILTRSPTSALRYAQNLPDKP